MGARVLGLLAVAAVLCGCTVTRQMADAGYHPPQGGYRLLVMMPDVSVGLLTAGGVVEPREDWTEQARGNVLAALAEQQSSHGADVKLVSSAADLTYDPARLAGLLRLHKVVGESIGLHKYGPAVLPTKAGRFDWTLGEDAVALGAAVRYDYALFVHAEDSFESGGRAALQVLGVLGCVTGVCIIAQGGQQLAFASLVDLKSGQIVWFNTLHSAFGDVRTPQGARSMVQSLLAGMSKAPSAPAAR